MTAAAHVDRDSLFVSRCVMRRFWVAVAGAACYPCGAADGWDGGD